MGKVKIGEYDGVSVRVLRRGQPVGDTLTCPYCGAANNVVEVLEDNPAVTRAYEIVKSVVTARRRRKILKQKIENGQIKMEEALLETAKIDAAEGPRIESHTMIAMIRCGKCKSSLGALDITIRAVEPEVLLRDVDFIDLELSREWAGRIAQTLGFPNYEAFNEWFSGEDLKKPKQVLMEAVRLNDNPNLPFSLQKWAATARTFDLDAELRNRRLKVVNLVKQLLPPLFH